MKTVSFIMSIDGSGHKLPAIKVLQAATGVGLKEAKDAVEALHGNSKGIPVRMTAEQFGLLRAYTIVEAERRRGSNSDKSFFTSDIEVRDVIVLGDDMAEVLDFTRNASD